MRTLPSAPQLTNTSILLAQKRTSNTSLSWAISWVFAVRDGMSQMVQVVSMLDVMIRLGETVFQSRDVSGAVCSGDFELDNRANGVNFCTGGSPVLVGRVIEFPCGKIWTAGRDHSRRWSPEVASRSHGFF